MGQLAANPEVLMRARYSAFALQRTDFIQRTWAAETCPADLTGDSDTQWVALKVISSQVNPPPRQHTGSVHFKATCLDTEGRQHCLEERSRFIKRQGEWFYLDGKTKFTEVAASL
ncbi:zinc chelation protein SecC [Aliidiomarina maris]|uniref:Zinc chelation protein SecC n=3 Tax=Aliidiomarina maris TaxID=531312 RepID=A0ABY0BPI9_9GAMM|nr:zinc chelation protein SecC [Aliidiomarina maris]